MISLADNSIGFQASSEINLALKDLSVLKHLRSAGIKKKFGYSVNILFMLVFSLAFRRVNWFNLKHNTLKSNDVPGKDSIYRFLNHQRFAWRKFLVLLSSCAVGKVSALTSDNRVNVLIVDESPYYRNRSKKVELLSRFWDHVENRYYKGLRLLALGWSDGNTFVPCDFTLLSSNNSRINGMNSSMNKNCTGYKRRAEALRKSVDIIPEMISRAVDNGIPASYVLMDSWFMQPPLIRKIKAQGFDVICRAKDNTQRFVSDGAFMKLSKLYDKAHTVEIKDCPGIVKSIVGSLPDGTKIKMVFVNKRGKKRDWLAIMSTDLTLTEQEIVKTYSMRWDIETFFKFSKSLLNLQNEFEGRSYDMLVSHATIVFARYIAIAWLTRKNNDERTIGALFHMMCSELECIDWKDALLKLLLIICDTLKKSSGDTKSYLEKQLSSWLASVPSYIRALLPIPLCES